MIASNNAASALGEGQFKLVYCALLGTMAVPQTGTRAPENPDKAPPTHDSGGCPLCQAIAATSSVVTPKSVVIIPPILLVSRRQLGEAHQLKINRPAQTSARDPPLLLT